MNSDDFVQLVRQHLPAISRLSISLLRNRADAEDVVQETLLKAFTRIHQLREGGSIRPWLMQIAVNEARMKMRDRRRFWNAWETESPSGTDDEQDQTSAVEMIPDPGESPHAVVERRQQGEAIKQALDKLSPMYREVFVLRDMLGIAGKEAAAILEIPEATLHTRLNRARQHMRKMLAPYVSPRGTKKWQPLRMMREMLELHRTKAISCLKVRQEMIKYLDGGLYGDALREIEEHVKVCSRCFLLLDTTRKTLQLVADESVLNTSFLCSQDWDLILADFTQPRPDHK